MVKQIKITVIIAGDRRQAENYARSVGLFENEWRFVNDINQVRGMVDYAIVYTGQYYLNKVHEEPRYKEELELRTPRKPIYANT
jgi:hypothetical protein